MYPYGSMVLLALATYGMYIMYFTCLSIHGHFYFLTNAPIILAALLCSLYTSALITKICFAL